MVFRKREFAAVAGKGEPETQLMERVNIQGRTYYSAKDTAYMLPKDMKDTNRLDFQHFLIRQFMKGNYVAPLDENISNILDLGCGTGRWCIEMANAFPKSQVIGLDLEELTLTKARAPKNYLFKAGNVFRILPFAGDCFDFVHLRFMMMSIPETRWPYVLQEMLTVTRPGGWIELVEMSYNVLPQGPAYSRWYYWIYKSSKMYGINPHIPQQLWDIARGTGMKNVQELTYDIPLGAWAGRFGKAALINMQGLYDAMSPIYMDQLGITSVILKTTWEQIVQEWEKMQARLRYYIIIGQK